MEMRNKMFADPGAQYEGMEFLPGLQRTDPGTMGPSSPHPDSNTDPATVKPITVGAGPENAAMFNKQHKIFAAL
eukprot:scaffold678006_cov48-Prasinocladus_malaysianus.AAC.1